jgi:hypothetical protein
MTRMTVIHLASNQARIVYGIVFMSLRYSSTGSWISWIVGEANSRLTGSYLEGYLARAMGLL